MEFYTGIVYINGISEFLFYLIYFLLYQVTGRTSPTPGGKPRTYPYKLQCPANLEVTKICGALPLRRPSKDKAD